MSKAKPVNTCSLSKDNVISMYHEDTYLECVIKTEEVDLEPGESEMYIEISGVKQEIEKNNEMSANDIPEDLNTDIIMEKIQESDTDITAGDEVRHIENINTNSKSEILKPNNAQNAKGLQICDICNKSCTSARSLRRHVAMKHPSTINVCTEKKLKIHTEEKLFLCQFCEYRCGTNRDFTKHLRTHTGEKPFSCDMCSFKSAQKVNLKTHLKTHISKPFSCAVCSYKSAEKSGLERHIRSHTSTKPYSCTNCSYKSARKSDLERHTRTHTGTKPFSCDICSYKSAYKSDLERHIRIHTGTKLVDLLTGRFPDQ